MNEQEKQISSIEKQIHEIANELDHIQVLQKEKSRKFEEVKSKRFGLFTVFFLKVKEMVERVYADLTQDQEGKTLLYLENKLEPYNNGVVFVATPPTKRFTYDTE